MSIQSHRETRRKLMVTGAKGAAAQHVAGRMLTKQISSLSDPAALSNDRNRRTIADAVHSFARMYEPHAAREDTVLFPALANAVSS